MSESGSERRKWPRVPASELSHITASVVAGPPVKLVNLSRGGALMEVASRLPMRSRVRLKLTLDTGAVTVAEGLVAWAKVAAIVDKQVNYHVAIVFDNAIPDLGGLDRSPEAAVAAPPPAEEPPAIVAAPPRDNLTHFPTPVLRVPEAAPVVDEWNEADEQVVSLDADPTGEAIGQAAEHVAALAAANEALAAQAAAADAERSAVRGELETERREREEERAKHLSDVAAAAANAEALQASLAAREQDLLKTLADQKESYEALEAALSLRDSQHASALSEEKQGYEALTGELLQANHDQQTAYQVLLDERTAAREQDRLKSEAHALELARTQEEATQEREQREQLEQRYLEILARLETAESLCAAHEARDRNLRREVEKLMALIASPVRQANAPSDAADAAGNRQAVA